MKKLILAIALLPIFFSCKKEEPPAPTPIKTTLEVAVTAEDDRPLPNAEVLLYDDKNKFDTDGGHRYSTIANNLGTANFSSITKGTYWVLVRDCGNNKDKELVIAVNEGENKKTAKLFRKGGIAVTNNSKNPYYLYINDIYAAELNSGDVTNSALIFTPGQYSFKLVQKSGYAVYPSVFETPATVEACKVTTWGN